MKIPKLLKQKGFRSSRKAYRSLGKARGQLRWFLIGKTKK
jgi:hypothetical protein